MRVICDIETDALKNPTVIWCIVAKDIDSGQVYTFDGPEEVRKLFPAFHERVSLYIGHNFISYDADCIRRLLNLTLDSSRVTDTLVLSRLLKYDIVGGHSLEAWGDRLGQKKVGLDVDFSSYSRGMLARCKQDVEINHLLYKFLEKKILLRDEFKLAVEVEHKMQVLTQDMHEHGFKFDVDKAIKLRDELSAKVADLDSKIIKSFPPRPKRDTKVYNPRATKYGTISRTSVPRSWVDLSDVAVDCPFQLLQWEEFNPNSTSQVVERLQGYWSPTDKTEGHITAEKEKNQQALAQYKLTGYKLNEKNLATLHKDAPSGASYLVERLLINGRLRTLNEWLSHVNASDARIHGRVNAIGTWTHRMSHTNPNTGNIAAPKSIKYRAPLLAEQAIRLGSEMRSLWTVGDYPGEEAWLVGTDAVGIQLRIFAHYINDPEFTKALVEGSSKDGSDAHTRNARILGCDRDTAKTFIYAFLLGAGDAKLSEILSVNKRAGAEAKRKFIEAYPGLKRLRDEIIPRDARRGFFVGLDGRLVVCDSEHLMLAGYLQNGEACIMKHATARWREQCDVQGLRNSLVAFVHDEWQTEVRGSRAVAEAVATTQREAIEWVGRSFGLHCPMGGESKIGKNWYETH
jgi:DNA polymerase-1